MQRIFAPLLLLVFLAAIQADDEASQASWHIDFRAEPGETPYIHGYDEAAGFGFEGSEMESRTLPPGSATTEGVHLSAPRVFSIRTGPGNFHVTLRLKASAPFALKSESRQLHKWLPSPDPGWLTLQTIVNVRQPVLKDGRPVILNPREVGTWHWDDRLQLELNGSDFILQSITVKRIAAIPTLFLCGDSTVTDQIAEPWTGWGQMLPSFFHAGIAIANHAESGETLKTFRASGRLEKVLQSANHGDWVMLQFGHNDMKERGPGIGPFESYSEDLRDYISEIRAVGAQPILITPVKRRRFDPMGRQFATHGDYPVAMRQVAAELNCPLIDLNFLSGVLFSTLGPEDSKRAFVHYPAGTFPGQENAFADDSHFSPYGGYQLARCIISELPLRVPSLAKHLIADSLLYDPSQPDPFEAFSIPASPKSSITRPEGS